MPQTVGHFQLLEPLGRGTLGELHRARDLRHGRTVALRLLTPEIEGNDAVRRQVVDAAHRVSELLHPVLAATYECDAEGGRTWIASEFVPGESLAVLTSGTALHPRRALDLAVQLADGLAVAHAHDVDHGALSTSAVVVTPKGAVKILDVGMFDWTRAGTGARQDDLAGLGAVLFEMLVGRPLKRGWPAELKRPEIPLELQSVLHKLTTTNPREQFGAMVLAASALRDASLVSAALGGERAVLPEARASEPSSPRRVALVGAVVAIGVVVAWWLFRQL